MMTAFDVFDALMYPLGSTINFYFKSHKTLDEVRSTYFRKVVEKDVLTVSIDLPGVKPSDVDVSLEESDVIRVTAKKDDKIIIDACYYVDVGFDAASVVPVLDLGVLKLTFNKLQERQIKKFKVLTT